MAASRAPRRKQPRKLALETLESRHLLSGSGLLKSLLPLARSPGQGMATAADPFDALRNSRHASLPAFGAGFYTPPPDDFGNNISTAHAVALSNLFTAALNGKVNVQGDVDMFSVVAKATNVMTVSVSAGATGGVAAAATFVDAAGQAIEPTTATCEGNKATYTLDVVNGQKYFFAVSAADSSTTGTYAVGVSMPLPPPAATIVAVSPGLRHTAVANMKIVFNRAVAGLTLSSLSLTKDGGPNLLTSAQTLTTSDHVTYTVGNLSSLTAGAGSYTLSLDAAVSSITDQLGNLLATGTVAGFVVDTTAPTDAIIPVTPNLQNAPVSQLQFVFSEAVVGVKRASLKLTKNGGSNLLTAAQTLTTTDNVTFTLGNLAGLTNTSGNYVLTLFGAGITDAAGNAVSGPTTSKFTTDVTPPTAKITAVTPNLRNSAVPQMQVVFSEAVTGLTLDSLSLSENGGPNLLTTAQTISTVDNKTFTIGNLAPLTAKTSSYTLTLTAGSGVTDLAGNALATNATSSFRVDVTPPTVSIIPVSPSLRRTSVPNLQLAFSEVVSGLKLSSLKLTKNGGANLLTSAQKLTTTDHITYTLTNLGPLTGGAGSYTLTLTAAGSGAMDAAGNLLVGDVATSFTVDPNAPLSPTVAIASVTPRNSAVSQMQLVFSHAVSGVSLAALSLSKNGGANLLTAAQTLTTTDNVTYILGDLSSLTAGSGSYTLTLTAANSGITDSVGNALTANATRSFVVDASAPTATITAVTPNPRNSAVSQIQVVFSEAVSGVTLSGLSLSKDGGANLLTSAQTLTTTDNITYTLGNLTGLTGTSGGYTLTLSAAGSGITDPVGNALAGDASTSFVVNTSQWLVGPTSFLPGLGDFSANSNATAVSGQVVSTSSGNVLVILGTTNTDTIILSESPNSISVATSTGNQAFSGPFVGVAVYGFGGGDTIRLDHSIDGGITSVVYGGGGDNTISDAGLDKAYLYAGSGNDTLISIGGGADYLYGGAGLDSFWFDSTDTLSGTTVAETAAKSIHRVAAFVQPTTDPAQAVSLEIAGQDIVDPVASYGYTNNFVNQPLWNGTPRFNDPRQGALDDCYFLAGLSALADTDPALLQQSIVALGDGTYAVRFFHYSAENYYRIDAQLPTNGGSPAYDQLAQTGALWVALEEKAFAQFRTGQNSYSSLNYGIMDEAYTAITGFSFSMTFMSSVTADALAQSMSNSLAAGHAVTAGSNNPAAAPIVSSHAYSVHAVTFENGTWYVTVQNPWGVDGASWDSNPYDGLLKLTASQFQTCFQIVETCSA